MNECDINYRQSSNKRLLVEITLIRVAQITQPDDEDASVGRSPKRLKSLFKKLIAASQQKTVQQVAAAAAPLQQGELRAANGGAISSPQQESINPSSSQTAPLSAPSATPTPSAAAPKGPALKLGSIGKSFANLRRGPEKPVYEKEAEKKQTGQHETFDEDMLILQWMSMCNRMPDTMTGTATRLKNITPEITNFPEIEIIADNKMLLEDIQKIKGRIRNTLIQTLHNDDIELTLRLARPEEVKKILSPKELYEELCNNNPAIKKLGDLLSLQFT